MEQGRNERHTARMQRQKAAVDSAVAKADEERGIVLLLTGNGKGKSSSAFGMLARALGHGQKAGVVQFIKGAMDTGEERFFSQHPHVDFHAMGDGFTWETQNRGQDIRSAQNAWRLAASMLGNPAYDLVILDEITYLFKYGYLPLEPVLQALKARPVEQSVILTGRGAVDELHAVADTVSVIQDEKHAFREGVKARKGVEF